MAGFKSLSIGDFIKVDNQPAVVQDAFFKGKVWHVEVVKSNGAVVDLASVPKPVVLNARSSSLDNFKFHLVGGA